MTVPRRHSQVMLRPSRGHIFSRIETGEVLPDNLVGAVLLYLLRPVIPGHDTSIRVKEIDRVFFDAIDQETKLFFARAQLLLGLSLLGQIAYHLAETSKLTIIIVDRAEYDRCPVA